MATRAKKKKQQNNKKNNTFNNIFSWASGPISK